MKERKIIRPEVKGSIVSANPAKPVDTVVEQRAAPAVPQELANAAPPKKAKPAPLSLRLSMDRVGIVAVRVLPSFVIVSDGRRAIRQSIEKGKPVVVTVSQ